jgi:hypothetical protein
MNVDGERCTGKQAAPETRSRTRREITRERNLAGERSDGHDARWRKAPHDGADEGRSCPSPAAYSGNFSI